MVGSQLKQQRRLGEASEPAGLGGKPPARGEKKKSGAGVDTRSLLALAFCTDVKGGKDEATGTGVVL